MIRTVADLLTEFLRGELPTLDSNPVTHAPTIGDMYEGLTEELLCRGVPAHLDLRVVTGFATDGVRRSGQIDRMLVSGDGESIPFTDAFVWHVRDIIAVVEAKKVLRSKELSDSLGLLSTVKALEGNWHREQSEERANAPIDASPALRSFAQVTGRIAPDRDEIESLGEFDQLIYHTLFMEQFSILRIAFGFHGYRTEAGLRRAFIKLLKANVGSHGFGPNGLPQLIISGEYALVKANGNPYSAPLVDAEWPFMFSSPANPLVLLLEVIWTRLDQLFHLNNPWGTDLEVEVAHPLLFATGSMAGWRMRYLDASTPELKSTPVYSKWEPSSLSEPEFIILTELCFGHRVKLSDGALEEFLAKRGLTTADLRDGLLRTHLVALDGDELVLTTINCQTAMLPDGRLVAAENNTGRLTRWLAGEPNR